MIKTEYRLVLVGVSVGPAYFPSKTCKSKVQACMSGVKGTPKGTQKRKNVKPYPKLMAPSCSSEHGLRGIGFGGSPIAYAGFRSCLKVQGNFLLCSSSNFVGYSCAHEGTTKKVGGGFSSSSLNIFRTLGQSRPPLFSTLPSCERGDNGSVGPVGLPVSSSFSSLSSLGSVA